MLCLVCIRITSSVDVGVICMLHVERFRFIYLRRVVRIRSMSTIKWNESEILVDRKSKFQARCCKITTQADIANILEQLVQENKAIQKATHKHMYAWRTADVAHEKENGNNLKKGKKSSSTKVAPVLKNVQQGSSDCGESGAGQRLLTLLERSHVVNVLVIVTRWYGGTALGPARFRHITTTAVESLRNAGFLT